MFPLPTNTLACVAPGTSSVAARRGNRAYPQTIDIVDHDLNMSAPQLPTEIVLRIMDLANASSNPKLLQSCSLVCKAWSSHAQKILFRSVSICTHRGYTALVAAFQAHTPRGSKHTAMRRGPHLRRSPLSSITDTPPNLTLAYSDILRASVVELNVIIDFNQYDGLTFANLSHLVSLCPNLRKIGISVFGMQLQGGDVVGAPSRWRMKRWAPPIPDEVLEELRAAPNASKISELRVNDWSDCPGVLIQLISIWPHIASLKIAGKLPTIDNSIHSVSSTISPGAAPCTLTLKTLSLNCATGTESSVGFVKWLLTGSQQTLRHLEFLKEPSGKLLEDILVRSAFPLESLHLPSCTTSVGELIRHRFGPTLIPTFDGDDEIDEDRAFTQVQDLKEVFVEDPSTPSNFLVSTVRSGTIQRFGFGVDGRTDLSPVARAIKAQTGLEHVIVWIRDGGERNFGLGSLRIACAIRGIELEEIRDFKEFRAWNV